MIYLHYETFNISANAAQTMGLDSTQMIRLKFASNKTRVSLAKYDFDRVKSFYLPMLKQIPSGKRKYDPIDFVWTIPASAFDVIRQLVEHEGDPQCVVKHKDIYKNFIHFTWQQVPQYQNWQEQVRESSKFQAEPVEEFFNQATTITTSLTVTELEHKLSTLIKPYIKFELETKEDFMRGYKLAARKYHPDLNKDDVNAAAKMSELNSLWMQYKEIA